MDSHSQNQTQNRNVVRRYTDECWNQGKTEVINEIFADNVRLHDPVFPHLTAGARSLRTHVETCRAAFSGYSLRRGRYDLRAE